MARSGGTLHCESRRSCSSLGGRRLRPLHAVTAPPGLVRAVSGGHAWAEVSTGGASARCEGQSFAERSLLAWMGALPGSRPVLRWFLCPAWAAVTLAFRSYPKCGQGRGNWRPRHTGVDHHCSGGLCVVRGDVLGGVWGEQL